MSAVGFEPMPLATLDLSAKLLYIKTVFKTQNSLFFAGLASKNFPYQNQIS